MISNILVPTDGSKAAQKAARYAIDLAKQLKCSIIVLSVIDNRSLMAQTIPAQENARHMIEPIENYLREAAEEYAGEIIVMGSHGRSALAAAFLGSVTYSIIHKETKIPVLVVRR